MGFEQSVVVSSPVSAADRQAVCAAAFARWPFARGPRDGRSYPDRAVFAPPELTSYLFAGLADAAEARGQNAAVHDGLPDWSGTFPGITFAYIGADCFGGNCSYTGYCCRDGRVLPAPSAAGADPEPVELPPGAETLSAEHLRRRVEVRMRETYGGLAFLLAAVGIELETGYFEPFVRGYFADLREDQWAGCTRPGLMLSALEQFGRPLSRRQRRLLAAAYLHRIRGRLRDERCRRAAEVCERAADGGAGQAELAALRDEIGAAARAAPRGEGAQPDRRELYAVLSALWDRGSISPFAPDGAEAAELAWQAALVRDLVGNPFRPARLDPRCRTADVVRLAEGIDQDRAFDRLPILGDALLEAGCDNPDVIRHCQAEGPHARGCWVLGLVLRVD